MENNELQKIWKSLDSEIKKKPQDELEILLKSKAKQTINRFLLITSISVFVSMGVIVFLLITSLNRLNDTIYLINNVTLGILVITSILTGLFSWYKLRNNRYNQPLKNWLDERISVLTGWLTGNISKLYLFFIPVLYILTVLSIHVYYEHKLFIEVLNTGESVVGLIIAAPIGLFISFFVARRIRKYQLQNLEFLKDLYARLSDVHQTQG